MGGVWCKADKGRPPSYSSKGPFNSVLSRWTDHVRQAYRRPKTHQRPMRPPKKPSRTSDRLTIGPPQLVREQSSDGWRTATLLVPEAAPVPPPRKKRRRHRDLPRTAYSMDDLNHAETLSKSTISLPDKCHPEAGLDSRSSSSTLVVTPVLESRVDHAIDPEDLKTDDDKENVKTNIPNRIEEEDEDITDVVDITDEIIPIEKETLSSRTLLYSNLGYVDKLSAISEVSAESGFEDRMDLGKGSERSESVTSAESGPRDPGLNIIAHINDINTVSHLNDVNRDLREKTALSKRQWLQNILKEDPEPYFISRDSFGDARRGSGSLILDAKLPDNSEQPNSLPVDHLHLMNREPETSGAENTPPPTPELTASRELTRTLELDAAHSVLLDLLQKNSLHEANPFVHREEAIFLTNTKTNIIYKSLSSDKLTDDYDSNYVDNETTGVKDNLHLVESQEDVLKCAQSKDGQESTNPFNNFTSKSHLSDYSFQTPKLVESDAGLNSISEDNRSNVVSSFDFKEFVEHPNYVPHVKELQPPSETKSIENVSHIAENGIETDSLNSPSLEKKVDGSVETKKLELSEDKIGTKEPLTKKDSISSSRKSSITDSLHEFEMSIYDMLKESKKNRESSDEDDSLKITKTDSKQ